MLCVLLLFTRSGKAISRQLGVVANIVCLGVAELLRPIAARTPADENVAVNLHHLLRRYSTARVQVVDVLRNEQELIRMVGESCDSLVRGVWLRIAYASPPLAVPIPNQLRVARERIRRRKFCRVKIPPVAILSAKSRDATFSRNTGAGQNKNTHTLKSRRSGAFQIIT